MSRPALPWLQALRETSTALQGVLGAVLEAERPRLTPATPLERLRQITTNAEWAWLRPLYQLIADIDHALAYDEELPADEAAAIGVHVCRLLCGEAAPAEREFLDRYRALLQSAPAVAMAHSAALQAAKRLPPEPPDESTRLHARHQWNERRRHLRERGRRAPAGGRT